ncbi:MAG: hypothetical protein HY874_05425 [Chloroflexi bacterium]|nr:hypothetical protein [Chloroflexota bacterium]
MRILIALIFSVAALASTAGSAGAATPAGNCPVGSGMCVGQLAYVAPIASPACTPSRPHASGTSAETITTGDGPRAFRLHVPPSYTGSSAVPVVLSMHGASVDAAFQEWYSGFSTKSDAEGFIVAYPEGVTTAAINYTHFNAWMLPSPEPDDVAFISTLLDALEAQLCIDHNRVYSTGLSNGAMLSVRLACSLSDRIAAIALVAGAYYPPMAQNVNPAETCPDATPVPVIAFHGTSDDTVPFNGGIGAKPGAWITYRLPIDDATGMENVIGDWSAHNGCTGARHQSQLTTEVRLVQYGSCAAGATVLLFVVDGGGHTWPGAANIPPLGYTTHQIGATDVIWDFFSGYPPAPPAPVGGVAELPPVDELALPAGSFGISHSVAYALGAAALAMVSAISASGWYARRKSR